MAQKLSPEMERALDLVREHGALVRYKGGFWQKPDDPLEGRMNVMGADGPVSYPLQSVGTLTIEALLKRNLLVILETKVGRHGPFAVRVGFATPIT